MPSPSKVCEPDRVVSRIGTPLVVMDLPKIVGPVSVTAEVFDVVVAAFLLAAVASFSTMVSTSPTRRAFRSANSAISCPAW